MKEPLGILRVGAFCPVGLDASQTAASVMAGVPRKQESSFLDRNGRPIVMGHLPTEALPTLIEPLASKRPPLTQLVMRLLRLATPALQEVLDVEFVETVVVGKDEPRYESRALPRGLAPPPLFLAGPQSPPGEPTLASGSILGQIALQAGVSIDLAMSRLFPLGHAGLFYAIREAEAYLLVPGASEFVIVGGVDSYFDGKRLLLLECERRLLTSGAEDAATPGEGSAFILLASGKVCRRYALTPLAWISAVGVSMETGNRYNEAPNRGDGLANAVAQALVTAGERTTLARLVMAGLTGERIHAKEWGTALLRNRQHFADPLRVEHPAEFTGDGGASLAPVMLAVTAIELQARSLEGPVLLWASSDQAERGALVAEANRIVS